MLLLISNYLLIIIIFLLFYNLILINIFIKEFHFINIYIIKFFDNYN
jgi:hypothetical protein